MVTKSAINQLPSLPQILVQILDAIHSDNADYQHIAQIIRHDTAVAARLIAVANSSYFGRVNNCETIERALLFLGTDTVKTIVITTSIKQYFNHFNQQHNQFLNNFWRRSLTAANFSQILATLTRYSTPDEAYLCGLLSDVGQLILLTENDKHYLSIIEKSKNAQELLELEQQLFSKNHCQLGSELIDSWSVEGFLSDAVRYHHEPTDQIQDAHHLVKIVNLANLLSNEGEISDLAFSSADKLFGLNEALTQELRSQINEDVNKLAAGLGINICNDELHDQNLDAHRKLGERLGELAELSQVNSTLWKTQNKDELKNAIRRALLLTFEITDSELFTFDSQNNILHSQWLIDSSNHEAMFKIPAESKRSIISDTFLSGSPQSCRLHSQPLAVIDRQLLRYCNAEKLVCWPLHKPQEKDILGVLVVGTTHKLSEELDHRSGMAVTLCCEIASVMANSHQLDNTSDSETQYQSKINEAVHEASNPLSIIRNYLETLRLKLGEEHNANEGLELIKEEIDRVGTILLRLKDPDSEDEKPSILAINSIIESTTKIFQQSICATKKIILNLDLDKKMPEISGNSAYLKQILTNLLKNAVECTDSGSTILVSSDSSISVNGKDYIEIIVKDNGPGIPLNIKKQLFKPMKSTKNNHAGLGLSIVKKLIDDMNGSIVCRSHEESGTQFQVLLPK